MQSTPWEASVIQELDLTSTELTSDCLENILLRMPGFTYLGLGYCEFFTDRVLLQLVEKGKLQRLNAIDLSYTHALSENALYSFFQAVASTLAGVIVCGKPKLTENFWLNVIPLLKNVRTYPRSREHILLTRPVYKKIIGIHNNRMSTLTTKTVVHNRRRKRVSPWKHALRMYSETTCHHGNGFTYGRPRGQT